MAQAVDFANELAPEHLEVCCQNPMEYVGKLDNAGSVFLGNYSPEPLGDYFAGPNHVLPTSGTARFFSPLSVDSFIKKSSFIYYTEDALRADAQDVIRFADTEGLTAHANSIKVLVPYEPISGTYKIRLDANECPDNLPDDIKKQIAKVMEEISYNRYPDPLAEKLINSFSEFYGIDPEFVTAGNGSDELIFLIESAFLEKGDKMPD